MTTVITYGTYDLLHYGHIRLLERAKALGDYLIVGVTADDFDKVRGKINVQQSLFERVEAVREIGIADKIIIEEYEGQKIDDVKRYGVDIFTVGSDWKGKFDYLNEYCKVVYLERTEGISSSEIREKERALSLGLVGDSMFLNKIDKECNFVNGITVKGVCTKNLHSMSENIRKLPLITDEYSELLENVDAVYIRSQPAEHYLQIKEALYKGKHVLCESPLTLSREQNKELFSIANERKIVLMEALKTAYSTAYARLLLLIKGGKIGQVVSVDATCTSLRKFDSLNFLELSTKWRGIHEWGPTALLPIFQILGTEYKEKTITTKLMSNDEKRDLFTRIVFEYGEAVATIKIGDGVKSEGELVISGTEGYIYVPAPWWKTDYFEIRYENTAENKRYFYQLDGEGIRYELVAFVRAIQKGRNNWYIEDSVSNAITGIMEDFDAGTDMRIIL